MIDSFFPLSVFVLIGGFMVGGAVAFILFGSLSAIVVGVCLWLGIIRILPVVKMAEKWFRIVFPDSFSQFEKNLRLSFPCKGASPIKKAIYLFHPHGLFSLSHFFHIGTKLTSWPMGSVCGTAVSWMRYLPFGAEFMDDLGFIPAEYPPMKRVLEGGESLSITLGGIREILECTPGSLRLTLSRRQGVFRLALETGTPLVPVLVYGETELYEPVRGPWIDSIQKALLPWGLCLPVPTLDSCKKWMGLFHRPLETPVRTVIGNRIEVTACASPSAEQISVLRDRYFKELRELYALTRPPTYATELVIV